MRVGESPGPNHDSVIIKMSVFDVIMRSLQMKVLFERDLTFKRHIVRGTVTSSGDVVEARLSTRRLEWIKLFLA